MKKELLLMASLIFIALSIKSQTLGNYSPVTIITGGNANIFPASSPSSTVKITVTSTSTFTGILTARATSGMISITNAKPAGVYTIVVRAFNSSGNSSTRNFILTVTKPECILGTFVGNTTLTVKPNLISTAVGDFNLDGKQDLVAAHEGFNTLSICMGNGHGGFNSITEIPAGSHPYSVAIGDLDRDGVQDIVNTNQGSSTVTVFLGTGAGAFAIKPSVNVGDGPVSIALGDFNNDGKPDFATANLNSASISIKFGDGLGGFTGNLQVSVLPYPSSVVVGDFNSDGNHDLAAVSNSTNKVCIREGNGLGNFSGNTEILVGSNPNFITVGDFNMDGKQDFATSNYLDNTVSIRLGNGGGNFFGTTNIPVGDGPSCVAVGNFNGDNFQDIATANYFSNTASIRYGNGTGIFNGTTEVNTGTYPIHVSVGDFNKDKRNDIAISNYFDHTISIKNGEEDNFAFVYSISNSPVCEGQDILLSTINGGFYSWTNSNGYSSTVQNPVIHSAGIGDTGIYNVTVTSATNCTMSASTTVQVNPLPVVNFSLPVDTLYLPGNPYPLSGGSPAGGYFSGQSVTSDNFFNPANSGVGMFILTYTYTDMNGCSNSDNERMYVLLNTGISSDENTDFVNVYPNPVKDILKIDLFSIHGEVTLNLLTEEGRLVKEWSLTGGGIHSISTTEFAKGIYLLKLISNDAVNFTRIVLED